MPAFLERSAKAVHLEEVRTVSYFELLVHYPKAKSQTKCKILDSSSALALSSGNADSVATN
jgi:hypothetical protein